MMSRRLVLLYLALVLVVAGVLSWSAYHATSRMYRQEVENRLLDNAAWLGEILLTGPENVEDLLAVAPGSYDERIRQYARRLAVDHTGRYAQGQLRITLIREDGVVLGDSEADSVTMENHGARPELVAAKVNGKGSDERLSASVGLPFLYHARWFPESGVFIRLALPLQALRDILLRVLQTALIGVAISLLLTAILARLFSRVVTAPVVRLTRQLSTMDAQHAGIRLPSPSDRDLGPLTRNVNGLAERLEESVQALGDRNAEMDTIISSLQTGLVAVDPQMRLIKANPVVFGMFGVREQPDVFGRPMVEVFRNGTLLAMLEAAVSENRCESRELVLFEGSKRVLEILVCPIRPLAGSVDRETAGEDMPENSGALAHVADVTSVRRLEEMRSQFVSNVTHELKTPLTSIRGFVETLRAGALSDERIASRFLEIIELEVERLSGLIDDVLSLSEIEGMKTESVRESFPLDVLVQEVLHLLEGAAAERGITLSGDIPEGLTLLANRSRVKQLLVNLVDNAIKYNRERGRVDVSGTTEPDGRILLRVSDTGIGIPEEFQERIFERFYRVDRGRARTQGGTGLGLSIVKHIAQLYGGTIDLKSEPGKGSTFEVTLQAQADPMRDQAGRNGHVDTV